jgi:uncharacterized membrane protein YdbT with pleckstrin-like domain
MSVDIDKLTFSEIFGVTFEPEETIRLICKPNLKACFGNEIRNILLTFLFIAGVIGLLQIIAYLFKSTYDWDTTLIFFGIVSLISLVGSIWTILKLRTTTYLITNLSVIIHHDFYNSSTKTINIRDIKTKESKKTIVDKYFKTGSIKIFTGETKDNDGKTEKIYDNLSSIIEPEKVFALL